MRVARAFIAHERPRGRSPLTNKGKSPDEVASGAAVPGGRGWAGAGRIFFPKKSCHPRKPKGRIERGDRPESLTKSRPATRRPTRTHAQPKVWIRRSATRVSYLCTWSL